MKTVRVKDQHGIAHLWVLVVVVIGVVGAVGLTVFKYSNSAKLNSTSDLQSVSSAQPLPTNLGELLTIDKVKQLAAEDKPSTTVSQVSLVQNKNGVLVFHVELKDGTTLDFEAKTGKKLADAKVEDDTEGSDIPAGFTPAISFTKAREIALTKVSDTAVYRIELEAEEGVPVYNVRFLNGVRVEVNALTGAVVKVKAAKSQEANPSKTGEDESSNKTSENEPENETESNDSTRSGNTSSNSNETNSGSNSGSGSGSHSDD